MSKTFVVRKKVVHLRAARPRWRRRVKHGPDERGAQVRALCGKFVSTADAVRVDRCATVDRICTDCIATEVGE